MQILQHWYFCLLAMSCGQSTKIMLSMPYRLSEFNLDDGSIQDFSSNWTRIEYSIDFDKHGFMYRASPMSDAILKFRYPLDDSKEILTHTIFANKSVDLAVDPVADHLYWVEYDYKGRIQRSDLNATNVITVLSLEFLSTLDIDVSNRMIYFSSCNGSDILSNCRILKSRLNGNDMQTLVSFTSNAPALSLRLDSENDRFYWIEHETSSVKSATLNGYDVRLVYKSIILIKSFVSFDIYGHFIYLSFDTQLIRIHKLMNTEYTVLYNGTDNIYDHIYAIRVYQYEETCLSPYQNIGDGCYFISNESVSGDEAFARCTDPGTYLANFETIEEAMVVKLFLQQMNTGIHYFIGGRNINRYLPNGDWRWIRDGKATRMTYFAFGNGQPGGSANDEQDCMVFYATVDTSFMMLAVTIVAIMEVIFAKNSTNYTSSNVI